MNFICATYNKGKFDEIRALFEERGFFIGALPLAGENFPEADETGRTFVENAVIKARHYAGLLNYSSAVVADDSGLVIDAIGGIPGVDSALYMGRETPYEIKNRELLRLMKDVPPEKRSARFVCAAACALPFTGEIIIAEGFFEGTVAFEPRGENGFGYDPIFFVPELGLTSAELPREMKNKRSHRGKAMKALLDKISGAA